jgi:molybdenum cofactor cytidylyltransferase
MPRYFAIIPACGQSVRMGRPKLLLPLDGRPLICHTIEAWQGAAVTVIAIVVRGDDKELAAVVRSTGVDLVVPDQPPPDMKASVQAALVHLERTYAPAADDAFLVAPADIPRLSPEITAALIEQHRQTPGPILAPTLAGRRGHPVLYPWPLAAQVFALGSGEGLNALSARHTVMEIPCDSRFPASSLPFADIDTPEQYRAASSEYRSGQNAQGIERPNDQT